MYTNRCNTILHKQHTETFHPFFFLIVLKVYFLTKQPILFIYNRHNDFFDVNTLICNDICIIIKQSLKLGDLQKSTLFYKVTFLSTSWRFRKSPRGSGKWKAASHRLWLPQCQSVCRLSTAGNTGESFPAGVLAVGQT